MKDYLLTYGLVIGLLLVIGSSHNTQANGLNTTTMKSYLTSYSERHLLQSEIVGTAERGSDLVSFLNLENFLFPETFTYQENLLALGHKNDRSQLGFYTHLKI